MQSHPSFQFYQSEVSRFALKPSHDQLGWLPVSSVHRTHLEAEVGWCLLLPANRTFCGSAGNSGTAARIIRAVLVVGEKNEVCISP